MTGWYSGSDDVVLATVATTRTKTDQDVIGCLQNTLPVRLRLAGADTASVCDLAADALFDALDHVELPVEDILRVSRAERSPGRETPDRDHLHPGVRPRPARARAWSGSSPRPPWRPASTRSR